MSKNQNYSKYLNVRRKPPKQNIIYYKIINKNKRKIKKSKLCLKIRQGYII